MLVAVQIQLTSRDLANLGPVGQDPLWDPLLDHILVPIMDLLWDMDIPCTHTDIWALDWIMDTG